MPAFSLICNSIGLSICLAFLNGGEILLDEAGNKGYITELKLGYWLWLYSAIFGWTYSILKNIQLFQKIALGKRKLKEENYF